MPTAAEGRSGRLMVIIAIALTLLGDLVVITLTSPGAPPYRIAGSVVRLLLTAALFYAIWRGHAWARWLTTALLGIGLILAIPGALRTVHPLMIGVMLQFAVAAGLLAFPPSVSAFLRAQRERRASGT